MKIIDPIISSQLKIKSNFELRDSSKLSASKLHSVFCLHCWRFYPQFGNCLQPQLSCIGIQVQKLIKTIKHKIIQMHRTNFGTILSFSLKANRLVWFKCLVSRNLNSKCYEFNQSRTRSSSIKETIFDERKKTQLISYQYDLNNSRYLILPAAGWCFVLKNMQWSPTWHGCLRLMNKIH